MDEKNGGQQYRLNFSFGQEQYWLLESRRKHSHARSETQ